jgi:catechol 2,3-dioxygenase-like lactoylglutathione lyase family enzyme
MRRAGRTLGVMPSYPPEEQLVLELFVRDFARSLAFYTSLGFEVERQEEAFAVLRFEGCEFLIEGSQKLGQVPAVPAANVRILVDDVDAKWELTQQLKAPVFSTIADRYYGLRDFTVLDPDGFGVRFASPIRSGESRPGA